MVIITPECEDLLARLDIHLVYDEWLGDHSLRYTDLLKLELRVRLAEEQYSSLPLSYRRFSQSIDNNSHVASSKRKSRSRGSSSRKSSPPIQQISVEPPKSTAAVAVDHSDSSASKSILGPYPEPIVSRKRWRRKKVLSPSSTDDASSLKSIPAVPPEDQISPSTDLPEVNVEINPSPMSVDGSLSPVDLKDVSPPDVTTPSPSKNHFPSLDDSEQETKLKTNNVELVSLVTQQFLRTTSHGRQRPLCNLPLEDAQRIPILFERYCFVELPTTRWAPLLPPDGDDLDFLMDIQKKFPYFFTFERTSNDDDYIQSERDYVRPLCPYVIVSD